MPRKNYNKMYEPKDEVKEEVKEEVTEAPVEEEKPKKKKIVTVFGKIVGGANLNVRKAPGGEIVTSLSEGTQVTIVDESNPDWYEINGPEVGFVMKKFVEKV